MSTNWASVKEYIFGTVTPGSLAGSAFSIGYTNQSINGEILSISYKSNNLGSLFIYESGTQELIYSNQSISGTSRTIVYPMVFGVNNSGAAVSGVGNDGFRRVVNAPIFAGGSGADGGSITSFIIRYR